VLWRPPLGDLAPLSARLADGGRAELIYPDRREVRAWPSFELLGTAPAGGPRPPGNAQAEGDRTAELTRTLGGSVSAVSAGVPAELVMVPGADHVFSSTAAGRLVYQAVTAWFERHQITDP
jgi:fermentation-respiration switch protein FrsA (DUF1100 family)